MGATEEKPLREFLSQLSSWQRIVIVLSAGILIANGIYATVLLFKGS